MGAGRRLLAHRLRFLFAVRAVLLAVILGMAGAAAAIAALAATAAGTAQTTELAHLSAGHGAGSTMTGAIAQSVLIGLIAFGLSAVTRRWIPVAIGMIIYLVGLEPVLAGLVGDADVWLPGAATAELLVPEPDLAHVAPTAASAVALVVTAIVTLRRERAAR